MATAKLKLHVSRGVDLSEYNAITDYNNLRVHRNSFAMLRASIGYRSDIKVKEHSECCANNGISVGYYMYTKAENLSALDIEINTFLDTIETSGVKPTYPVAFDLESTSLSRLSLSKATQHCARFIQRVSEVGYTPLIYSSASHFKHDIDISALNCDLWVACWLSESEFRRRYSTVYERCRIWQYTDNLSLPCAFDGRIDADIEFLK